MGNYTFELDHFAENEFYDIIDYYKKIDQNLSFDFIKEFERAVKLITAFPKAGHPYLHRTRRVILNRFPYSIIYRIYNESTIVSHAIIHMK